MEHNYQTAREFQPYTVAYGQAQEDERQSRLLIQALELQEILETLPFDPLQLYCVKTGQPRAVRSYPQLYSLAALHDKDQAKFLLTLLKEDGCATHWAQTDGYTLDKLRTLDPVGYFIYAADRLVRHHYKANKHFGESDWQARAPLFQQKIINYKLLADKFLSIATLGALHNEDLPHVIEPSLALDDDMDDNAEDVEIEMGAANIAVLHVANGHLAKFLAYDVSLMNLPWKSIGDVVHSLTHGNLYHTLAHCFKRWIVRETEYFNPGKLNDLLTNKKGSANFRTKRETNQEKRTEELLRELAELGVDIARFREPVIAKSAYNPKSRTETFNADLLRLGVTRAPAVQSPTPAPKSFLALFAKPKSE